MNNILKKLYQGKSLSQIESEKLFNNIIQNHLSPIQIGSVLISMKIRGETLEEILGAANALSAHSKYFPKPKVLFADITGTGGDNKNTLHISTISAIVASVCDVKIIKHGNYSASSVSGSMDFLKQFKYTEIDVNHALNLFNKLGICFLCASQYYKILKDLICIRKELNTPTIFNILGPLINPSKPPLALIGVYKKELLFPVAQILKFMQYTHHAIIVHCDGIDEVGLHAPTNVFELNNGAINDYTLTPSDFGLNSYPLSEICYNSKNSTQFDMIKLLKGQGKLSHISVIAANAALLLKLFGYTDLRSNVLLILDKISQGDPYKKLLSLSRLSTRQQ